MLLGCGSRDFVETKVFIATVIVQSNYCRQSPFGILGFQHDRLRARTVSQLPTHALDRQPIATFRRFNAHIVERLRFWLRQTFHNSRMGLLSPSGDVVKSILQERESSRLVADDTRCPRTIATEHIGFDRWHRPIVSGSCGRGAIDTQSRYRTGCRPSECGLLYEISSRRGRLDS